jgi:hypothetical protein
VMAATAPKRSTLRREAICPSMSFFLGFENRGYS